MLRAVAAACVFAVLAPSATANPRPIESPNPDGEQNTIAATRSANARLAGSWSSSPDELRLSSDFDKSVWGPDAIAVRTVELRIEPNGAGRLTVTRKVVDARKRTVPGSTSIEEAALVLGDATPGVATRIEHAVTVEKAERRYPDDPDYRWPLDGLKVRIATFEDGDGNTLEVRFDTPEGRGSFWETLRREGRRSQRN